MELHDEIDGVAFCAAAETHKATVVGIDGEARGAIRVKGAACLPFSAGASQLDRPAGMCGQRHLLTHSLAPGAKLVAAGPDGHRRPAALVLVRRLFASNASKSSSR